MKPSLLPIMLHNWSVGSGIPQIDFDPFLAPELRKVFLSGDVTDHPRLGSGWIHTTAIIGATGRIITTASGSRYRLGRIKPSYRRHLRKIRPQWDWRNPITEL